MKKLAIALVAILLVIVLAFGMFACNKTNNNADTNTNADNGNNNTDNGNGNGNSNENSKGDAVTEKVGDVHYAKPQASNITAEEVNEVMLPFANKIANSGAAIDEQYDVSEDVEIGALVASILREGGVDKAFLQKYITVADTMWTNVISEAIVKINNGEDIWATIADIMTATNVQTAMTTVSSALSEVDVNQLVAVMDATFVLVSGNYYEDYGFDAAAVDTKLAALGVDRNIAKSATAYAIIDALKSDEGVYLLKVALQAFKNLSAYSPEELANAGKVIVKVLEVGIEDGFENILTSDTLSYREMVSLVNTVGKVAGSMLDAIGDTAEFGKAVTSVLGRFGVEGTAVDTLAPHIELVRPVTNLLATVTVNDVTNIYSYYDDWSKNQKTDTDGVKFAKFVGSIVNFAKGEYGKLSVDSKVALSTFLGDSTLYTYVDSLINAIPEDVETMNAEKARAIQQALDVVENKVKNPFDEEKQEGAYYVLNQPLPYLVVAVDTPAQEVFDLMDKLGYEWEYAGDADKDDVDEFADMDELDVTFSYTVDENGKGAITMGGDSIAPTTVPIYASVDAVISFEMSSTFRFAVNTEAAAVARRIVDSMYGRISVYDKGNHNLFSFRYDYSADDVTVSGVDFAKAGEQLGLVSVKTPYGVAKRVTTFVVYDPQNKVIEELSVSLDNSGHVALNTTQQDLKMYVYAIYTDGTSESVADYTVEDFDSSKVGNYFLKVNYQGISKSAHYYVYDPNNLKPAKLYVTSRNSSSVEVGTAWNANLVYVYLYTDDGNRRELSANEYTVQGFDTSKEKYISVRFSAFGLSDGQYFNVMDYSNAVVRSIYVGADNYNINQGDTIDALGLRVYVYYEGDYPSREVDVSQCTVEGFDTATTGYKSVILTYGGQSNYVYYSVDSVGEEN